MSAAFQPLKTFPDNFEDTIAYAKKVIAALNFYSGEKSDCDPIIAEATLDNFRQNFYELCDDEEAKSMADKGEVPVEWYICQYHKSTANTLLITSIYRLFRTMGAIGEYFSLQPTTSHSLSAFLTNYENGEYVDYLEQKKRSLLMQYYHLYEHEGTSKDATFVLESCISLEQSDLALDEKDADYLEQKMLQSLEFIIQALIQIACVEIAYFDFDKPDPENHSLEIRVTRNFLSVIGEIGDLYFETKNNPTLQRHNEDRSSAMAEIKMKPPVIH